MTHAIGCGDGTVDWCQADPEVKVTVSGTVGPTAKLTPKDYMGANKLPVFSVVPPTAVAHLAAVMRHGAWESMTRDGTRGYGPYNWRKDGIRTSVYVDAAMRHVMAYWDGEEMDRDSGLPHLAHAMATLAILLDAQDHGRVQDDRPPPGATPEIIAAYCRVAEGTPATAEAAPAPKAKTPTVRRAPKEQFAVLEPPTPKVREELQFPLWEQPY